MMNDQTRKFLNTSDAEDFSEENCISDALLLQFIEGTTTAEETTSIQEHLNECALCSHVVASVYYNKAHPFTEEEQRETQKLLKRSPEEQVAELLKPGIEEGKKSHQNPVVIEKRWRPRSEISWWQRPIIWRPAFALSVLLFLLGGQRVWHYWQTDYQLQQATALLTNEHRLDFQDVRWSGGYASGTGPTMDAQDHTNEPKRVSYLERAEAQVEMATAKGAAPNAANQVLLQIYMFKKEYARADSLVRELEPLASKSPVLSNDLGVYYYHHKAWSKAEEYFTAAAASDAKLSEARFNLALAQARLGAREKALANLAVCLKLEKDAGWIRAARKLQATLKSGQAWE